MNTFYFCDLDSNGYDCPKRDYCKRYQLIKDTPYKDYQDKSARLWNVCNLYNYSMFLKMDEPLMEEKEIEQNE